jgi:hypothetical protein
MTLGINDVHHNVGTTMLSVVMLSVVILSDITLSVVAPNVTAGIAKGGALTGSTRVGFGFGLAYRHATRTKIPSAP